MQALQLTAYTYGKLTAAARFWQYLQLLIYQLQLQQLGLLHVSVCPFAIRIAQYRRHRMLKQLQLLLCMCIVCEHAACSDEEDFFLNWLLLYRLQLAAAGMVIVEGFVSQPCSPEQEEKEEERPFIQRRRLHSISLQFPYTTRIYGV